MSEICGRPELATFAWDIAIELIYGVQLPFIHFKVNFCV